MCEPVIGEKKAKTGENVLGAQSNALYIYISRVHKMCVKQVLGRDFERSLALVSRHVPSASASEDRRFNRKLTQSPSPTLLVSFSPGWTLS